MTTCLTARSAWRAAALLLLPAMWFATHANGTETVPALQPGKGWRYSVFLANVTAVDNLALAPDGTMYATQELARGEGRVVRIQNNRAEPIATGLNRPDGLLLRGKHLYVTEEVAEGRVLKIELASGKTATAPAQTVGRASEASRASVSARGPRLDPIGEPQVLATLHNPEGIDILRNGNLVVAEDSVNGRLVQLHKNGTVETIIAGLNRPEGIAVAKDGTIYIAETGTGRVLAYKDGVLNTLVDDLDEPDQVEIAPDGALWIAEDAKPGRLLRFKDGILETVMAGLLAPQGMAFGPHGIVYVAEQGRHRILLLQRVEN
ncbi:MAG: hypothetical protein HY083_06045 [Gammaproteobacteria bacterium]|nr:hypothetical protein [Gammaproteobacteria bacterium]